MSPTFEECGNGGSSGSANLLCRRKPASVSLNPPRSRSLLPRVSWAFPVGTPSLHRRAASSQPRRPFKASLGHLGRNCDEQHTEEPRNSVSKDPSYSLVPHFSAGRDCSPSGRATALPFPTDAPRPQSWRGCFQRMAAPPLQSSSPAFPVANPGAARCPDSAGLGVHGANPRKPLRPPRRAAAVGLEAAAAGVWPVAVPRIRIVARSILPFRRGVPLCRLAGRAVGPRRRDCPCPSRSPRGWLAMWLGRSCSSFRRRFPAF
jgi:hypothetical protein